MSMYFHSHSLNVKYRQNNNNKKITRPPDTNILERTWEYKMTRIYK